VAPQAAPEDATPQVVGPVDDDATGERAWLVRKMTRRNAAGGP
jgi:hypothetical protein